jgi:hypothetical protein
MSEARDKRREAVEALLPIKSYRQIAEEIGCDKNTVAADAQIIRASVSQDALADRQREIDDITDEIIELREEAKLLPDGSKRIMVRAQVLDRRIKLLSLQMPQTHLNVDVKGFFRTPWFDWFRLLSFGWDDAIKEEFKELAERFAEMRRKPVVENIVTPDGFLDD